MPRCSRCGALSWGANSDPAYPTARLNLWDSSNRQDIRNLALFIDEVVRYTRTINPRVLAVPVVHPNPSLAAINQPSETLPGVRYLTTYDGGLRGFHPGQERGGGTANSPVITSLRRKLYQSTASVGPSFTGEAGLAARRQPAPDENELGLAAHLPRTKRGEATRQRILQAAEEVFGTLGFHRASIIRITQRAGIALGTFYIYFDSKEQVFRELVVQLSHEFRKAASQAIAQVTDRRQAERVGFEVFFRFIREHPNLYRVLREAESVDESLVRWYYSKIAEGYARRLREAMKRGQVREMDPETLAYCLMAIGNFLGMRWVLWEDRDVPEYVIRSMLDFIMHGLDPEPKPQPI